MADHTITLSDQQETDLQEMVDAENAITQNPVHQGDPVPPASTPDSVFAEIVNGALKGQEAKDTAARIAAIVNAFSQLSPEDQITSITTMQGQIVTPINPPIKIQ